MTGFQKVFIKPSMKADACVQVSIVLFKVLLEDTLEQFIGNSTRHRVFYAAFQIDKLAQLSVNA